MTALLLRLAACVGPTPDADDPPVDSGVPEEVRLPIGCEPGESAADPLSEASSLAVTAVEPADPFMEIVDVDLHDGEVWAVGQGGLLVASLGADGQLVQVHRDPGNGRFHRVERLDSGVLALTHRDQGLSLRHADDPGRGGAGVPGVGLEGLAAVGERVYVSDRAAGGVGVLGVPDAGTTVRLGFGPGASTTWELLAHGGALYGADNDLGLVVYDLAEPDAPAFLGAAGAPGAVLDLAVSGTFLYAARGTAGVDVWAIDDPLVPTWVGNVAVGGSAVGVAAGDGWLWVVDHESVAVFALADPAAPTPFAREETRQFALAVAATGDTAVVGDWGYLEAWHLDATTAAPALDLDRDALPAGDGEAWVDVHNRGGADLELRGGEADGAEVVADRDRVAPGASARVTVRWTGPAPTTLCLATNDPDAPTVTLPIGAAPEPPVGSPAPDFVLSTLDGEPVRLADQLGHPVVLAYFATW